MKIDEAALQSAVDEWRTVYPNNGGNLHTTLRKAIIVYEVAAGLEPKCAQSVPNPSEISVVDEFENGPAWEAAVKSMSTWTPAQAFEKDNNGDYVVKEIRDMWRGYRAGLKLNKPVSLKDCIQAMLHEPSDEYPELAKAVLDAAGVKYE